LIRAVATGIRLSYQTNTGFTPTSSVISELRAIIQPSRGARDRAKSYSPTSVRVYRDLYGVAFFLKEMMPSSSVDAACDQVMASVQSAIKWEGHNNNSNGSHGISIDFSSAGQFAGQSGTDYGLLRFAGDTQWNEWLTIAP
jgi:hypothetical protein